MLREQRVLRLVLQGVVRFTACFCFKLKLGNYDGGVCRFAHIVEREGRGGSSGKGFHLDSSLPSGARGASDKQRFGIVWDDRDF